MNNPNQIQVTIEVGYCPFCRRTRNLRREERHLGALVLMVDLPEGVEPYAFTQPAFSPDGDKVIVVAGPGGKMQLWIRSLDAPAMRPLPGTEGATQAVFSPDSHSVAFLIGGSLRRLDLAGGAIQTIFSTVPLRRASSTKRAR